MFRKPINILISVLVCLLYAASAVAQDAVATFDIDANNSCMPWYFITSSGKRYTCGADSEYSRGVCKDMKLKTGEYEFRYGGHHGVKVRINGDNDFDILDTEQNGLYKNKLSTGRYRFDFRNHRLLFEQNGFPGTFSVEGESLKWRQNRGGPGPNEGPVLNGCNQNFPEKNALSIMVDAPFLVTGEWVQNSYSHINGSTTFVIDKEEIKFLWKGGYAFTPVNKDKLGEHAVTPNPNYWLNGHGLTFNGGIINAQNAGRSIDFLGHD